MKFKGFTSDQRYSLLQKMGYSGPKNDQQMEQFLASNPGASAKLGDYTKIAQDRITKKFAEGGTVTTTSTTPQQDLDAAQQAYADALQAAAESPDDQDLQSALQTAQQNLQVQGTTFRVEGVPSAAEATGAAIQTPQSLVTQAQTAQIQEQPDQILDSSVGQQAPTQVVTPQTVQQAAQAQAPTSTGTSTYQAAEAGDAMDQALEGAEAATGAPTAAATVRGQLEQLMADFEGGATPPWASGAMRQAMGIMQQRGLGASSMAGQAVVQAAMESAIAVASQDAQINAQFEMQNLNNRQQMTIFKTQQRAATILSDQAAQNASLQFNAASENQTQQFFAGLQESVARFNADQVNSIMQFNAGQTNAIEQFNSQLSAARDQFNAQNSLIIAQANAQWRQNVATLNTAAQNEANMENARMATGLTAAGLDYLWQTERDLMSFAFTSSENAQDRRVQLIVANKTAEIAKMELDAQDNAALGSIFGSIAAGLFG